MAASSRSRPRPSARRSLAPTSTISSRSQRSESSGCAQRRTRRSRSGPMSDLVLATRNPHKVREFQRLLAPHRVLALPDDVDLPPEVGLSFEENAMPKARAAAFATRSVSIADDSGIEAEALGGAPGVYSARFAGPDATDAENLAKLLTEAPAGSRLE